LPDSVLSTKAKSASAPNLATVHRGHSTFKILAPDPHAPSVVSDYGNYYYGSVKHNLKKLNFTIEDLRRYPWFDIQKKCMRLNLSWPDVSDLKNFYQMFHADLNSLNSLQSPSDSLSSASDTDTVINLNATVDVEASSKKSDEDLFHDAASHHEETELSAMISIRPSDPVVLPTISESGESTCSERDPIMGMTNESCETPV
jgi:hypothetical protein